MLSTDSSRKLYDQRAPNLFEKYGGDQWPSVILPDGFNDAVGLGDFGYGCLIVDDKGIVRSAGEHDIQNAVGKIFSDDEKEPRTDQEKH